MLWIDRYARINNGENRCPPAKSADDLAKMKQRFGQLSDTDLDAYRFLCTQLLG